MRRAWTAIGCPPKNDGLLVPAILAAEIVDNLEAALEQFRGVSEEPAGEGE